MERKMNYLYDAIGYLQSISITCSNGTKKIDYLYDEMDALLKKMNGKKFIMLNHNRKR